MPEQQAILEQYSVGKRAVLAAPGAGKTTLISHLIAHWITQGRVKGSQILVLTFTESAAREFAQRTSLLLDPVAPPPVFSTIHGFCNRLLRQLNPNYSDCGVASDERRYTLADEVLDATGLWHTDLDYARLLADVLIPRYRQQPYARQPASVEAIAQWAGVDSDHAPLLLRLPELIAAYDQRLHAEALIDYDTMIAATYAQLKAQPRMLKLLQARYPYMLEDEAQDSNPLQTQLLMLMAGEQSHLLRVGDPNQGIYGFNGADVRSLSEFAEKHGAFPMGQSNRSSEEIMALANRFHRAHPGAFPSAVELTPGKNNPPAGWIWMRCYPDTQSELGALLQAARRLLDEGQTVAVLCRTNLSCQWLYEQFLSANLPAVLHHDRAEHFFQSEISRLLRRLFDYLLQADQFYLLQQLLLELGISRTTMKLLFEPQAPLQPQLQALAQGLLFHPAVASDNYQLLLEHVQSLLFLVAHLHYPVSDLLEWVAERLLADSMQRTELRLLHSLWQQSHQQPEQELEVFRAWLDKAASRKIRQALVPAESEASLTAPGVVHLLTTHKAKGLEWDGVLMPLFQYGQPFRSPDREIRVLLECLQQQVPYQAVLDRQAEAEEQETIRLVYVALTRARRFLSVTTSKEACRAAGVYQAGPTPLFNTLYQCYRHKESSDD